MESKTCPPCFSDFEAPVGAIIDISHGEIIGSNNF